MQFAALDSNFRSGGEFSCTRVEFLAPRAPRLRGAECPFRKLREHKRRAMNFWRVVPELLLNVRIDRPHRFAELVSL